MYRNPNDFPEYREYSETSNQTDYSTPDYYQQPANWSPRSAQPSDPYAAYPSSAKYVNVPPVNSYASGEMSEYLGPQGVDGYTVDAGAEQRDAAARGSAESGKRRKGLAGAGSAAVGIGAWLLKLKGLVYLLKFGGAGITALISIAVYSLIFGWPFAVGLVGLLFIHEMGHAVVMKMKGIAVGSMIFIPMLGAAVTMRQMPDNARDEAEVGIAGPIAGAIASSACLVMAQMLHASPVWAALAYFGFFMNLFNLIPIVPFDGGRVLAAIDRRVWIIGFLGLLAFQIWSWINGNSSIWLLFFIVMAATQLWSRNATSKTAQGKAYYDVPIGARITLGLLYFGLAAVLVLGMSLSSALLPGLH